MYIGVYKVYIAEYERYMGLVKVYIGVYKVYIAEYEEYIGLYKVYIWGIDWLVKSLLFYCDAKLIENFKLFYKSNRPHFLWVYRRDNPRGSLREHEKSL